MKITNFVTPPEHINFLAKNLFGNCGEIINGSIAYLEPTGEDLFNYIRTSTIICLLW